MVGQAAILLDLVQLGRGDDRQRVLLAFNQFGYVFTNGVSFYLALFTGTGNFHPPDGIYTDPLFGWVKLRNNQGVIEMLGGAIEYGGAGIYAGTQTIIAVPEPSQFVLVALGSLLFGYRRLKSAG